MRTDRFFVHGRVQGVGFRAWTVDQARRLGLSGWVRNRRDGRVEILARGGDEPLATFLSLCRQGPLSARVTDVDVEPADDEVPEGFEARMTV